MKRQSVKLKITLWLTLLMVLLFGLLLTFVLMISRSVVLQSARQQLSRTAMSNVGEISYENGTLTLSDDFKFYDNGVTTLIYSQKEARMAGQVPVAFQGEAPFVSGSLREVDGGQTVYLLLDLWVPSGWDTGVWQRALMAVPSASQTVRNLLLAAMLALPMFLLLASLGSWLILRRAFRPLDRINATAAAIGEAKDLSRRIGLPAGRDEFSSLAASFDQLFARLERSFEAETQFAADASHELRTPVAIIKSACEYGKEYDETREERQETLAMIHRQADAMSALISGLLTMTRLEQGTELPSMTQVELGQLTAELLEAAAYEGKDLRLQLDAGVTVRADPALLGRLIRNLVDNAAKFTPPGGQIQVIVTRNKKEALLIVRDNGIGIAPEHQEKIWQRFYQADPSRSSDHAGAGLGLAMVEQIARLHGGSMSLKSQPGQGSEFTLHLPG